MNKIKSISEVQEAVKEELSKNVFFEQMKVPLMIENSKTIEYEIKSAMTSLGIAATVATPSLTYKGNYGNEGEVKEPFWEINTLNVVIVENPTLNRGKATFATALDTALQVSYTLNQIANIGLTNISQTTEGGLIVVTVSAKSTVGFMLEKTIS